MKLKVIGLNPIRPEESVLLKDTEVTHEKAVDIKFNSSKPVARVKLMRNPDNNEDELIIYIGEMIPKEEYEKKLAELKRKVASRKT